MDPDTTEHIPAEAASTYTKLAEVYGQAYYQSVARIVLERLAPGSRLLDVGTGPGFLPLSIASQSNTAEIHAFDYTEELVRNGRNHATRRGFTDRISFFVGDCYRIPVPDESYSFLTSTGVLHTLTDPDRALREWYRVLEPGGIAWVFDPAILELPEEPDVRFTEHEREVFEAYGVRSDDDEPPITMAEATEIAIRSPFDDVEVRRGRDDDVRLYLGVS